METTRIGKDLSKMGALEQRVGYLVCPLNVETLRNRRFVELLGMYNDSGAVQTYNCAVTGGFANMEGGRDSHGGRFSMHPCTLEYAEGCPLFREYKSEHPFVFDEGGAMMFKEDKDI